MNPCGICGFEGDEVSLSEAIGALAEFPQVVAGLLAGTSDDVLRRRPGPRVWSPLEYAAHSGESIAWYHTRIDRALTEQQPTFLVVDWDAAGEEGRYRERATGVVLAQVAQSCVSLVARLGTVEPQEWCRSGIGSDGSMRSVAELVRRAAHEAVHHGQDIRDGLSGLDGQRTGDVDGLRHSGHQSRRS